VAAAETACVESRFAVIPTVVVGSTAPPRSVTLIGCRLERLEELVLMLPDESAGQPCRIRPELFWR